MKKLYLLSFRKCRLCGLSILNCKACWEYSNGHMYSRKTNCGISYLFLKVVAVWGIFVICRICELCDLCCKKEAYCLLLSNHLRQWRFVCFTGADSDGISHLLLVFINAPPKCTNLVVPSKLHITLNETIQISLTSENVCRINISSGLKIWSINISNHKKLFFSHQFKKFRLLLLLATFYYWRYKVLSSDL